jgi:hypothetical protein
MIVGLSVWSLDGAHAQQAPAAGAEALAQAVPCAACHVLSLTPEQIAVMPERLDAARMVVRVTAGTNDWVAALASLRARGARAGVHVIGVPADGDPVLAVAADVLIIEPGPAEADRLAFDLKRVLAEARGLRTSMPLVVAAPAAQVAALRERGLAPYVDDFMPPSSPIATTDELAALLPPGPFVLRVLPASPAEAAHIAGAAAALQAWLPEGLVRVPDRVMTCGEDRRVPVYLNSRTLDLAGVSASCPSPAQVTSDVPGAAVERVDLGATSVFLVRAGEGDRFASGVDVAGARALTADEIVARHQAAAARQAAGITTAIARGTFTLTFEAPGFVAPIAITSETTIFSGGGRTEIRQADIRVNGAPFSAGGGVPRLPIIEPERAAAPPLAITLSDVYRYRLSGQESVAGRPAYVVAFEPRDRNAPLYRGRAWIDTATFGLARVSAVQTGLKGPITASEQNDDFAPDASGRWLLTRSDVRQTYEGASVRSPIHRRLVVARHDINAPAFTAERAAAHASRDVMLRDTPDGYRYLVGGNASAGSGEPEAGSGKPPASVRTEPGTGYGEAPREPLRGERGGSGELPAGIERVLAGRADRIRTFAFGVIVDPNISRPLPFAGLSYVDFNLFGTGTQFSGFFGGAYGQLAFSAPSIRGTRWQIAGRAFGIASFYNDRAFEQGREQYELDIRQRPAQVAVWLLRPLSARTALRIEYDWDYTRFARGDLTAPAFVIPRHQNAHGFKLGLDAQRAGWQGSIWASHTERIGWREWGVPPSGFAAEHGAFQRFGASVLRALTLSPRVTTRVEAAVMGGRHLDRFSRFAFGTFDNRLHGYPSALIRYDRGGVARSAVAWSVAKGIRLDGFADTALVRDPGFGRHLRNYTGFGAALETPAPFGMLLAAEWGYGIRGVNADGRMGTHVVRITGYKIF